MICNFQVLRSSRLDHWTGRKCSQGEGGKVEPEQGGFFLGPEGLSFNRNIGQICLNVYFLFYSFVYFSSPCREDQLAVFFFFNFFYTGF